MTGRIAEPATPTTPNAEKYVLAADALRRRQLETALLHGSAQTWRDRRRLWPAMIGGVIAVALVVTIVAIVGAFHQQQEITKRQEEQRHTGMPSDAVAFGSS